MTIVRKHSRVVRYTHWINAVLLCGMIVSGLMIAAADDAYRIGLDGVTLVTLFPWSFYTSTGLAFRLHEGLAWHFFLMWLFAANGLVYLVYTLASGHWRKIVPRRGALRDSWHVLLHDLRLRRELPATVGYNAAQRLAYTFVVLAGIGSIVTGLAIYKPTQLAWLTDLLGGYRMARFGHFWLTMGFVVFILIHLLQVARAGWSSFRSMASGYEIVEREETPA